MKEGITTCVPSFCFYTKNSYRKNMFCNMFRAKTRTKSFTKRVFALNSPH